MDESDKIYEKISHIKASANLPPPPPVPVIPVFNVASSMVDRLNDIQNFIISFDYNYSGKPFFKMKRSGGSNHIQTVSKQLIKAVCRIPLSFKSKFKDGVHRHIVTAVCVDGLWGALGISRRDCLMFKAVQYSSVYELIEDFRVSYESVYHKLLTVYLGLPFPHTFSSSSDTPITWRAVKVRMSDKNALESKTKIEAFSLEVLKTTLNVTQSESS